METLELLKDQSADLISKYNLSDELNSIRKEFSERLQTLELPTRRTEDWKYTNIKGILANNYLNTNKKTKDLTPSTNSDFNYIYFLNGECLTEKSDLDGIEIISLKDCSDTSLLSIISKENYYQDDFMTTLNMANLSQGSILKFNKDYHSEKPIIIHREYAGELSSHNINNIYVIEKNSKVEIIEKILSDDNTFINISSSVFVKENSVFSHNTIQDTHYGSLVFNSVNAEVAGNANYQNTIFNTGAKLSRTNLYIDLTKEGANCDAHGLYALHRDQHHDTMSYIHHNAPHTESRQLYKGILDDESRGVFTGKVRVEQNAQLINAEQLNKNLILTKKAQANSRPQLEIYADDVKCAHGSTTGQLSDNELFYFEARGIKKEKARQILARAFAYDVVLKINNLKIRNYIKDHLIEKHIVR